MASRFQLPPIVKASETLLVAIEQAVRRFPRYHRYQIGADLRRQAMAVHHLCHRAWRDRAQQHRWVDELVWEIDKLKQYLQTGKLLHAFSGFREFEELARQAVTLGMQAGGWRKQYQQHPNVQNAEGHSAIPQRDEKLSTCAASTGANP